MWQWVKDRYPNETMVNGAKDQNLRCSGGLILTHGHVRMVLNVDPEIACPGAWSNRGLGAPSPWDRQDETSEVIRMSFVSSFARKKPCGRRVDQS